MKSYLDHDSVIYPASISDFSTYQKVVFFDGNGVILYQPDASYIDTNPQSSRSTIGDFNGDSALDIATATTDILNNENKLIVRTIETFDSIYELNLKELGGTIYERLPLFTVDTNNDSQDEIALLLLNITPVIPQVISWIIQALKTVYLPSLI